MKLATENGKKERVFLDDGDRRGRAMANPIDHQHFLALLSARFPEVTADMDESVRGLLHCEMGTFARATNTAIRAGDAATVQRHFRFADEVLRDAAPDVRNAIAASYLETLALCGRHAKRIEARRLLTPRLGQTLTDLEEDLARLYEEQAEGDG